MADDDYTPEQKSKIARHFLYMAPHGEVSDIVKDLKKVVKPSTIINDDWVKDAMAEYHVKKFSIITGDTSKVITCPQAKVQNDVFLHPDKKILCHIDTVTQVLSLFHLLESLLFTLHGPFLCTQNRICLFEHRKSLKKMMPLIWWPRRERWRIIEPLSRPNSMSISLPFMKMAVHPTPWRLEWAASLWRLMECSPS